MSDLSWLSISEMSEAIRRRDVSPVDLVDAVLRRQEVVEPHINAFVTMTADAARKQARIAEQTLASTDPTELPPLFGIPVTVKDLTDTAGVRTTYGSPAFSDHVPAHDGINWARLKKAGAILVGKTTTPEFGGLGVTDSPLTGVTSNPWRTTHTSGGSSGGAAASVAAGVGPLAWGSDGGGSIRVPAACCGVVGLKASRGRIPVSTPWDSVGTEGPLTRTVLDAAIALAITAGPTPGDPLALEVYRDDVVGIVKSATNLRGVRMAFVARPGGAEVDHEVASIVEAAVAAFESAGAFVTPSGLAIPDPIQYFEDFWSPGFVDPTHGVEGGDKDADASTHPAMRDFARKGALISAAQYLHTQTVTRGAISTAFAEVHALHDLIVMPTMPVAAFPHPGAEAGATHVNGIPVRRPAIDFHRFTESPSHAGLPAVTVPCGFTTEGLPVGLQIVGPLYADAAVLRAAAVFEQVLPWAGRRPAL